MDTSKVVNKISGITKKVDSFNIKIKGTYNKFAEKINKLIDEIEEISNKIIHSSKQQIIWLEIKLNELLKKLSNLIKTATDKINSMTNQAKEWYDETIKSTKITAVKSYAAKIGKNLSDPIIENTANTIPHPSFNSLMPEIKIDLQIPVTQGYSNDSYDKNNSQHNSLNLKKIPLL